MPTHPIFLHNSEADTVRMILRQLQAALRAQYGREAPALLLYGSYARGEENQDSDIDVLLLYPKDILPGQEIVRVQAILADLNLRYQVLISVLPASMAQYQTSTWAFWQNVRREGILLDDL